MTEPLKVLVSVIIPTRNRQDMLDACLRSVVASTYRPFEVIVIDNASTDGTSEMVRRKYPHVHLIANARNLYLAEARNMGMALAKGDYFLFIDDDNEVDPRMVEELVALMEGDPKIGLAGPKMYYHGSDVLLWTGAVIDPISSRTVYRGADTVDAGLYQTPCETEHIPNVVLMKRCVYRDVGGYDEVYRMSYADADLPMRARRAGYKVMYCPTAITYHKVPLPTGRRNPFKLPMRAYFFARNRVIYMKRFSRPMQFAVFMMIYYPCATIWYVASMVRLRDWRGLRCHALGTWHGLLYAVCGVVRQTSFAVQHGMGECKAEHAKDSQQV